MRALGVEPSPRPVFVRDFGDLYLAVLGEARAARPYPLRTWLERGFQPAVGTDAPVCTVDPLPKLHAMLTRLTRSSSVLGPEERVGSEDALSCYTEAGACLEGAEAVEGRLPRDRRRQTPGSTLRSRDPRRGGALRPLWLSRVDRPSRTRPPRPRSREGLSASSRGPSLRPAPAASSARPTALARPAASRRPERARARPRRTARGSARSGPDRRRS